jgi:predicted RNase H-like nuclease (RuvC/YqgF family)
MVRDARQLQSEISQLIKKQLDSLGREIFGGAADAEHREYQQRQKRIDELYGELWRTAAQGHELTSSHA